MVGAEVISYSEEFDAALEQKLRPLETSGCEIKTVILFGSLSNRLPKLAGDGMTLLSDVDILVIIDDAHMRERGDTHFKFGHRVGVNGIINPFSRLMPSAEILVNSASVLEVQLAMLIQICNLANKGLGTLRLSETAFLQALSSGLILRGEIPSQLQPHIGSAIEAVTGCYNKTND